MMEKDPSRMMAMLDRRRELMEEVVQLIVKQQGFDEDLKIEVGVELGEIYGNMFDLKYGEIKHSPQAPKKTDIELLNSLGFKTINFSSQVFENLL